MKRGFSFIETMIVLGIVAAASGVIAFSIFQRSKEAEIKQTFRLMSQVITETQNYISVYGTTGFTVDKLKQKFDLPFSVSSRVVDDETVELTIQFPSGIRNLLQTYCDEYGGVLVSDTDVRWTVKKLYRKKGIYFHKSGASHSAGSKDSSGQDFSFSLSPSQ